MVRSLFDSRRQPASARRGVGGEDGVVGVGGAVPCDEHAQIGGVHCDVGAQFVAHQALAQHGRLASLAIQQQAIGLGENEEIGEEFALGGQ